MALKTGDYIQQGGDDAKAGRNGNERYPRDSSTWQARAYWAGYDANKPAMKTPLEERIEAEQVHWPRVVREHVSCLAAEAVKSLDNPKRFQRLGRAMTRIRNRYGINQQGASA